MDEKQPSALDEALEIMSIGDHGNESDCNNPTGTPDRKDRTIDDPSVTSSKGGSRKRRDKSRGDQTAGRWTPEEHQDFLEGLKIFGREWKKVAERIPTRTSAQIRSHAQKYFAKLARDESTLIQDQAAAAAMVASRQQSSIAHEVVPQKTIVLSESVQRNVERILANPSSLEKEVEDTLHALRERYKQLQIRLEDANRRNSGRTQSLQGCHIVENEDSHLPDIPRQTRLILDGRKRTFEECSYGTAQTHHNEDMSSVSSACFSPTRELVGEELIALSVLGGSLSRSTSQQELPQAASSDENSHEEALRQAQNASPTSSIGSHRAGEDDLDDRSDQAKKLKLSDEDTETTTHERSGEDATL
jgi:SHAQKYF class myb-like DNA-binding protein